MNFSEVLTGLKQGLHYFRTGWNGKGMFIALQTPDENSFMSLPYIFIHTADTKLVPWVASQTDILAEDWLPVDQEEHDNIIANQATTVPTPPPVDNDHVEEGSTKFDESTPYDSSYRPTAGLN